MNLEQAIAATLVYSDIFDFPLKLKEISYWLPLPISLRELSPLKSIRGLVQKGLLAQEDDFYFLPGREKIVVKRKKSQRTSRLKLEISQKVARILIKVPGVLLVGLTGNLAMMDVRKNDDIDFLIITQGNKIWTARFLAVLLLEILGRRRRPKSKQIKDKICLNLFLDEAHLYLGKDRQDLYTAHEILQMKPLAEKENIYWQFLEANLWVKNFLPNAFGEKINRSRKNLESNSKKSRGRRIIRMGFVEWLLGGFQLWHIRKGQTRETIKTGQLFFHPQDKRKEVMEQYRKKSIANGLIKV